MTTPASDSSHQERQLARWYETFLDALKLAKRRDMAIVCHPTRKRAMMDMMERAAEDPLWGLGDLPPLLVHIDCPKDEYRFADQNTLKILSARAAMNGVNKGLGRYGKLWTPGDALKREI